jgi:hypothetical protein
MRGNSTLIQTGKVAHFPDWLRTRLLVPERVGPLDLALVHVTDDPTRHARSRPKDRLPRWPRSRRRVDDR